MRRSIRRFPVAACLAAACATPKQPAVARAPVEGEVEAPLRRGFTIHRASSTIIVSARVTDEGIGDVAIAQTEGVVALASDAHQVVAFDATSIDAWLEDRREFEAAWAMRCDAHQDPPEGCRQSQLEGEGTFLLRTTWQGDHAVSKPLTCDCIGWAYTDHAVFVREAGRVDPLQADSDGDARGSGLDAADCPYGDVSEDEDDEDAEGRCCEALTSYDREVAGFFAGRLQSIETDDNGGCSGVHVTDSGLDELALVDATELAEPNPSSPPAIIVDGSMGEIDWQFPLENPSGGASREASEQDEDEYDDVGCTPLDGWLHSLHRGSWVTSNFGTDAVVSCVWHYVTPARPGVCPTAADPCGDPAPLRGLAETTSDFWVANDGALALVWSDPPELWARAADGKPPIRVRLELERAGDGPVIGVREFADVSALEAALASRAKPVLDSPARTKAAAVRPAQDVDDRGDGRAWANHCFAEFKAGRMDAAVAACEWALTMASSPAVRGAIYDSLGRVAEARGHDIAAAAHYRTSLALRENETTAHALDRVLDEQRGISADAE